MLLPPRENHMSFNDFFGLEPEDKELEKCKNTALRYITAQVKSEGQIADYLKRKGFLENHIKDTIQYLRDYNYVDDRMYCVMYYKEAARKGKGRRRIEQELLNKKISKSAIRDALDEFVSEENPEYQEMIEDVGSESERALAVGRKMLSQHLELGKPADKNFMAKVGRRLMSLGYDSSILYSVIGTLMKEGKTSDDDY